MAQFITGRLITGSSGTLPPVQAGDLVVIMAIKWDSTSPTPTVPSGWTSLSSATNTYRRAVGYRVVESTSSSTSTSVWTNAEALIVAVCRDGTAGVAASNASASNAAGPPALTLTQPGRSIVLVMGSADGVAPGLPAGTVERLRGSGTGVNDLYADTGTTVSTWGAQSGTFEAVAAIEVVSTTSPVTSTLAASWQVEAPVASTLAASWAVEQGVITALDASWVVDTLQVVSTLAASWRIERLVTSGLDASWQIISLGNWQTNTRGEAFRAALEDPNRVVSARCELVYLTGKPATYLVAGEPISMDFNSVSVEFTGEVSESWKAEFKTTDPAWVPTGVGHPLDVRSQYAIRVWWGLRVGGDVIELPIGTFRPSEPDVLDRGTVEVSWTGRDMLAVAKDAGYGGQVIDVGGWTVDKALTRLFATISPRQTVRCAQTDVELPAIYMIGSKTPDEDWTDIAATAGWVVRTDREGAIVCGPQPDPAGIARSLQEGESCPVSELRRRISDTLYNRVIVRSSSHEVDPPVWGTAQDDDPGSATWIGNGMIRELPIDSDAVTTVEACTNMAKMHLGKYLRPTAAVSAVIPPDPTLDYRDRIMLGRAKSGIGGEYRVSKWAFDLPVNGRAPGLMTVTMMRSAV